VDARDNLHCAVSGVNWIGKVKRSAVMVLVSKARLTSGLFLMTKSHRIVLVSYCLLLAYCCAWIAFPDLTLIAMRLAVVTAICAAATLLAGFLSTKQISF
jgi:hypothetical protein